MAGFSQTGSQCFGLSPTLTMYYIFNINNKKTKHNFPHQNSANPIKRARSQRIERLRKGFPLLRS